MTLRIFTGDKWTKAYGSRIPIGAEVEVLRFMPRRRALVQWRDQTVLTMLWCLKKPELARERCLAKLRVR